MKSTATAVDRRGFVVALRVGVMALLLGAWLDRPTSRERGEEAVVVALDMSASVSSPAASEAASRFGAAVALRVFTGPSGSRLDDDATVIPFALRPATSLALGAMDELSVDVPAAEGTNIERALRAAVARLPEWGGTVLLVTDGRETAGDSRAAAETLFARASGRRLLCLPVPMSSREVWVDRLEVPVAVATGEAVSLSAVVRQFGDRATNVRVRWLRDGQPLSDGDFLVEVPPSKSTGPGVLRVAYRDRAPASGRFTYRVQLSAADGDGRLDDEPRNDSLEREVEVGEGRRVLFIGESVDLVGCRDTEVTRATLPLQASAVEAAEIVLVDDVPSGLGELDESSQELLARAVSRGDVGLLTFGASRAYGPGGFSGAPLESALPFLCRPRDRQSRLLLVLLDRSGSMDRGRKLERAAAAVRSTAALLAPDDSFGLLTFADTAKLAVDPMASEEARKRLPAVLDALEARGDTQLAPALEQALELLESRDDEAALFVITDGKAGGDLDALGTRLAAADVRVSVFLTGRDAEEERLRPLIRDGGNGSITRDVDARFLDTLLRDEWTGRDVADGGTAVTVTGTGPFAAALRGRTGDVERWARSTERPTADVAARAARNGDALLASWRYGEGRVLAAMSPLRDWNDGSLSSFLNWVAPVRADWFEAIEWARDGRLVVRVRVQAGQGDAVAAPLELQWGERAALLRAQARDRAQGTIDVPADRSAPLLLERGGVVVARRDAEPLWASELRAFGVDESLLRDLARIGGGAVLGPQEAFPRRTGSAPSPFHGGWWLPTALVLLLVERFTSRRRGA